MKLIDILYIQVISWLSTPKQLQVRWQNLLSYCRVNQLVDGSCITNASITYCAQALTTSQLQTSQQWVSLDSSGVLSLGTHLGTSVIALLEVQLRSSLSRLSLCDFILDRISSYSILSLIVTIGKTSVKLLEIRSDLL